MEEVKHIFNFCASTIVYVLIVMLCFLCIPFFIIGTICIGIYKSYKEFKAI